jgi:predicted ArsR family transcriptional regulator
VELLTIENVAAALRVSAKTVRRHVADDSLP